MLWVALHFPHLPPGAIEPIAAWACQFTPRVALEPPQALLLEVEGSLRYFGGLEALLHRLQKTDLGYAVSLGVASTARAALWFARAPAKTLQEVRLEATGWDLELFKSIGISTLGELMRLPREGLARRCGPQLLDELDRALGSAPEVHEFFVPPARFAAKLELPAEVTYAEGLLFAARRLLVQLEGLLAARHAGIRSFAFQLIHSQKKISTVQIGLASPSRDAERLAQLLRERLGALPLAAPVEAIALEAADFTPLPGSSADFFDDAAADAEDWARLLERLRARLGQDAVCGLTCYPDHRPEHAWRRVEPGDWEPREFTSPGPRPVWLLEPSKLEEDGFVLLAGPERIECGWWDGDDARRDYFIARLKEFSLAWIYREEGVWYLHGLFA
jgi:protein ImuB